MRQVTPVVCFSRALPSLAVCALVACALVPSAAQAARPGTLVAVGQAPTVAVDANGTGYVAYNDQPPGRDDQPVGLCVVAPGASRCSSNRDVLVDGNSGEAVPPLISATGSGHLTLAAGRCCGIDNVEMVSNDAGSTFTAPETIGSLIYFDGAIGPAGQALFVDGDTLNGVQAQVGSPGSPADLTATLMSSVAVHATAAWAGSTPVVVGGGHSTIAASYSGSGDPNDGANWNNVRVPGASYAPSLASGPTGLFLLEDTGLFDGRLTISRFEGSRFGPARVIVNTRSTLGTALADDPAGHLLAMWYDDRRSMFAAASRDLGVRWTRPHRIATGVDLPSRMSAALGPGGRGWLVYDLNAGSEVRLIPVNADALLGIRAPAPRPKSHRHHKPRRHQKPRRHRATHRHHRPKRRRRHRHRAPKRHATLAAWSFPGSGARPDLIRLAALAA